ncbi:MAG TPA: condensation domain-containing protein, partial [Ktedonobacteraceae bacterium]|nr:condensation domain-containing protein [Ktedonobacteraceae bacterium]
ERRLVAYVAPQPAWSSSLSGRELRSYLRERLPDYMVPAVFMVMETLPLTPNGKIDKAALPVPDPGRMSSDASTLVSRTPVQELLVGIWQQVLGLETVGIDDDFFALGGHSLLATQVHSRLRATFALDLPLRVLFEASTIADLATRVEMYQRAGQGLSSEEPPLVPRSLPGPVPLSFAQQRLWFLDQWEPESPLYNVASAVRLVGRLDVQALRESLQRVVMRHESLRTTFASSQGQPMQIIAPALEIALPVIDLSALPSDERDALAAQLATEEAQQPFSLAHGPLLRVQLVRLHKGEHALILSMHHIVADGWSLGVLVRELGAFYTAEVTGAQIELPALPLQYADYALWQRQWLQGEVLERQLAYWRNRLSGAPELLNLPIDYVRPEVQSYRGASQSLTLPPALLIKLRQLSQREGMTLFMTLLAIFQVLLAFASGQEDVVVGTPIANRTRPELEGLIGFFVNTLVLRTNLEGDPTIQELLQRVRETCLGAYAHQDLPFEQLVQLLHIKRTTSHMPLFQIWFVLMEDNAGTSITLPGLTFEPQTGERNLARYDLRLNLYTGNDGLRAVLEYQTDLFARTTIERMLRHFALLLQQFADAPAEQKLSLIIRTLRDADQRLLQERQETVSVLKMQKLKRVRRESVRGVAE